MIKKICFKCKIEKPLDSYYKHKQMSDGHLNKCKDCTKIDVSKRVDVLSQDESWCEKEKERNRKKYHSLNYREKHKPSYESKKSAIKRYNDNNPEKLKAKGFSQNIKRNKGNNLHHWSYNNEHFKDIIELSVKDHNTLHRFLKYDKKTFMYKSLEGELLDTKEKHLSYINKVLPKVVVHNQNKS